MTEPAWFRQLELNYACKPDLLDNPECWRAWEMTIVKPPGLCWQTQYDGHGRLLRVRVNIPPQGDRRHHDQAHS